MPTMNTSNNTVLLIAAGLGGVYLLARGLRQNPFEPFDTDDEYERNSHYVGVLKDTYDEMLYLIENEDEDPRGTKMKDLRKTVAKLKTLLPATDFRGLTKDFNDSRRWLVGDDD